MEEDDKHEFKETMKHKVFNQNRFPIIALSKTYNIINVLLVEPYFNVPSSSNSAKRAVERVNQKEG